MNNIKSILYRKKEYIHLSSLELFLNPQQLKRFFEDVIGDDCKLQILSVENYNIFSNIIDSAGLSVPNFIIPVTELDNYEFNKYETTFNFDDPFYIGKNPLVNILLKI